jgi:predicted AlkP superfamily phosphohydrolase/phosphomutase
MRVAQGKFKQFLFKITEKTLEKVQTKSSNSKTKKVLALVLDAAEPALIEKWMKDGSLPNLKHLREKGVYGRLASVAEHLSEAVPYTFYSGTNPASHGALGYATWHAESMKFRAPSTDWIPALPFWRSFPSDGPRTIALDVSNIPPPTPFNGIEIVGWASHDSLAPFTAYPLEVAQQIQKKYGSSLLPDELYGPFTKKDFLKTRDLVFEISKKFGDLCVELISTEKWDFFLGYTFALHHGGHRMWNTINVTDPLTAEEKSDMDGALHHIYMEVDAMVGKIVQTVDSDATVMVFSLHGMGINHSRSWILPNMLNLIFGRKNNQSLLSNFLRKARTLIPLRWRHEIKTKLPFNIRRGLTRFWRVGYNWKKTKAFALLSDTNGWVRINLKGREAQGIVDPNEYETMLEEISLALKTFVDEDTGQPLVKNVIRASHFFSGEKLHRLPDLIVYWSDSPSNLHQAIVSPQFGRIEWPTPGKNPEGRSGNHNPEGFMIACGPEISPGNVFNSHILDLAPTILHLLEQPIPSEMEGKIIQFPSKFSD